MDNRKKETQLRMERDRGGWTVSRAPSPEQPAGRTPMPAPSPMPIPLPPPSQVPVPMPVSDTDRLPAEEECGYCVTLAMAYVPMQEFSDIYEPEQGFGRGTIFAELDLPFMGKGDCRRE